MLKGPSWELVKLKAPAGGEEEGDGGEGVKWILELPKLERQIPDRQAYHRFCNRLYARANQATVMKTKRKMQR